MSYLIHLSIRVAAHCELKPCPRGTLNRVIPRSRLQNAQAMSSTWNPSDRCPRCGRSRRYFGMGSLPGGRRFCQRCLMWYRRNRCFQIMDALCSNEGNKNEGALLLHIMPLWQGVVTILRGSIQEMDMHVQVTIWQRVLCGDGQILDDNDGSSSESDGDDWERVKKYTAWILTRGASIFWKFWMLDVWGKDTKALIPRYNDNFKYDRIIRIIIVFLGPFSYFGLTDGYRWHRGWRFDDTIPVHTT